MDIEQLEAFIYIATTGSFSKAAEILFISQPSISSKIKVLEKDLGFTLFERSGSRVYLSEEGEVFLPYAQEAINNIQRGKFYIKKMNNVFDGEVVISVVFSGANYILPKIIHQFNKKYPKIKLVVYSGHSDQVLGMVLEKEVSVGIVRSIFHPEIDSIQLKQDKMILVFHPDHSLNSTKEVNIKDLSQTPLVLFKQETFDWILINNVFKKAKLTPSIAVEIDSIEGAKQMVRNNIGASFLPNFSVKEELKSKELITLPVTGIPEIHRNFELIFTKGETFDEVTKLFINFLKKFTF
ncbi:LysR family transcriptional regulator [Oceanobacillus damuensis]|uniref:LysR family transcriptional regulator n=1 Tax=Oceanobacillus damuensis TaxID=937928 RepID=UPI0008327FF2|nr:LysR family transcriptional regulator [Oceanobacillus damuensis]